MTLKFVIILQNLIKAHHRKSGKSKYDRKLTELDVETTRIRSRACERGLRLVFLPTSKLRSDLKQKPRLTMPLAYNMYNYHIHVCLFILQYINQIVCF